MSTPTEQQAGRELDAKIAVLMGWRWVDRPMGLDDVYLMSPEDAAKYVPDRVSEKPPEGFTIPGGDYWNPQLPRYSSDISAAWQVVEKMKGDGESLTVSWRKWLREFLAIGIADLTASEAAYQICLAALKAVGDR